MQKNYLSLTLPLVILFIALASIIFFLGEKLRAYHISDSVLLVANFLLLLVSSFNIWMHSKAAQNKNPHVFSRSVMGGTFIKLMVFGAAAVIYLLISGEQRSVYAIFVSMFMYILYTVIEVRITLQLNQKK